MTDCDKQITFSFHPRKEVVGDFRGGEISSDAGLLPLVELDRRLEWTGQVAAQLEDPRQAAQTEPDLTQLIRQRFFGLVAGYEDGNDHNRLKKDPILKAAAGQAVDLLAPIVRRLRERWPKVKMVIRGDAAFGCPALYDFCEANGLGYIFGWKSTAPLQEQSASALTWVGERHERTGESELHLGGFPYRAGSWPDPRRILYKVEANAEGTQRRFGVTNRRGLPARLWPFYNDRGTAETFIDDFKNGLNLDRLSCHRFEAHAFRLLLSAAAYNLLRVFRGALAGTELESATTETIRTRLIKIGARVRQTARRIWVHLSSAFPLRELLARATAAVQALASSPVT